MTRPYRCRLCGRPAACEFGSPARTPPGVRKQPVASTTLRSVSPGTPPGDRRRSHPRRGQTRDVSVTTWPGPVGTVSYGSSLKLGQAVPELRQCAVGVPHLSETFRGEAEILLGLAAPFRRGFAEA